MEEQPGMDPTELIQKSSGSILHSSLVKVRLHSLIPTSQKTISEAVAMERDLQLSSGARQLETSVILNRQHNHNNNNNHKHKKVSKYENSFKRSV